jgi:hypothetical protein
MSHEEIVRIAAAAAFILMAGLVVWRRMRRR